MKGKLVCSYLLGVFLVLAGQPATAQESGGQMQKPWWNPFSGAAASNTRDSSFFNGDGGKEPTFQWPQWKWPSLKRSDPPSSSPLSSSESSSLSLGSPSPSSSTLGSSTQPSQRSSRKGGGSTSRKPAQPSTFSKFGAASKKFWSDTADFINPFDQAAPSQSQGYRPQDLEKRRSAGGFSSWFKPKPPEKEISDVNGFLKQPRPRF